MGELTLTNDIPDPRTGQRHRLKKGDRVRVVQGDDLDVIAVVTEVNDEDGTATLEPEEQGR